MKKSILSAAIFFLFYTKADACSWYDADAEYFNLFTQSIIKDKSYLPFLHTFSNRFYGHEHFQIADENIESWQKFFGNKLNYEETKTLVEKTPMSELNAFKKGNSANALLTKLGPYQNYSEGIDYLIEAKYLEPYMRINYVESPDSFYYRENENNKNATQLNYQKTIGALTSLYHAAKNPEIKLRYGYQLVRFNHYTRNYEKSVEAFKTFVEPLKLKSAPYFLALDQLAGAQRGLKLNSDANWNFFQVFMNSKSRKESAFVSMRLSDSASFDNILKRTQNNQEKNMAYFLLGYEDFSNPIPMMEKMYEIDPNSEILKVMAARSINELERSYLPIYYNQENKASGTKNSTAKNAETKEVETANKVSFWDKIVSFFKNIFSSSSENSGDEKNPSDQQLLNNPNRLPFFTESEQQFDQKSINFLDDFEKFTNKTKEKSDDEFWQIADAYLKFLKKDYGKSTDILAKIKTNNPEYIEQINRMKMLNDIVAQPKIDAAFEDHLMKLYPILFTQNSPQQYNDGFAEPTTEEFLKDIIANRYFLQGEAGKSFLMNNKLSDLQYNPDSDLVKSVEEFYKKPNKTNFEQQVIAKNLNDVGNIDAFFNVIYGDREMRLANFEKAKSFYQNAENFSGIPRVETIWRDNEPPLEKPVQYGNAYNGFQNISDLVFGHNAWESFESNEKTTMRAANLSLFPFIKSKMSKLELAESALQLKKIGDGKDEVAAEANQLLGNLLYNTSVLGYYRELFVMDVNNENGEKFHFWNVEEPPFRYYYKNFTYKTKVTPDNFDLAINYYKKALDLSNNREQKARILFQMASAEQGKYYQYEAKNTAQVDWSDPDYERKQEALDLQMAQIKNTKYRTYFADLKKNYGDTQTSKSLMGSCSYYDYFMKKQ